MHASNAATFVRPVVEPRTQIKKSPALQSFVGDVVYLDRTVGPKSCVIDLARKQVVFHSLVAHGKNSGEKYAKYFSNEPRSRKSSLGIYVTGETYNGKHGYSLKLDGMDTLYNDRAREREIVMHGAHYVSDEWAKTYGRIGRSWGCPALPEDDARDIIDAIKEGCVVFAYYDDAGYFAATKYLDADETVIRHFEAKSDRTE